MPGLAVTLLLNIQRRPGETAGAEELVVRFARRLWERDWPGGRHPQAFYDPRALEPEAGGVLHAKAVVADEQVAFVTSAKLTDRPSTATSRPGCSAAIRRSPPGWCATSRC